MVEITNYRPQLLSKVNDLAVQLDSVKSRVNSELNCPASGSVATQCQDTKSEIASITIQPDFELVSNITQQSLYFCIQNIGIPLTSERNIYQMKPARNNKKEIL